jgi:hypothetical protein
MNFVFLLLISLISHQAYAQLNCSADGYVSSLFYKKNGINHELVDFSFEKSSYIPSYEYCAAFLDYVRSRSYFKDNRSKSLGFQKLITEGDNHPIRLLAPDRKDLYKICIDSKACKILFPYYVLDWPLLKNELFNIFEPKINTCDEAKFFPLKDEVTQISPLPNIDFSFWEQPDKNMISELNSNMNNETREVHISSMTISEEEIATLDQKILKFPKIKIYVYFSYPFNTLAHGFPKWMDSISGRVFFYPITTNPDILSNYHIKGVAIRGSKDLMIFSSSNFRHYRQEKLHDLGFTISNTELVNQFINLLASISKNNCNNHRIFNCHLEARFPYMDNEKNILRKEFARGCQNIVKKEFSTLSNKSGLILRGPLRSKVFELIGRATKSIEIYSHQFKDKEIIALLMDKISKGIDVKVLVGKHKSISDEIKKIPNLKLFHSSKEMHIKVVIIDNQSAFLMSANITESSLENKLETGFYINDQEMIQSLKNYLSKNQ